MTSVLGLLHYMAMDFLSELSMIHVFLTYWNLHCNLGFNWDASHNALSVLFVGALWWKLLIVETVLII